MCAVSAKSKPEAPVAGAGPALSITVRSQSSPPLAWTFAQGRSGHPDPVMLKAIAAVLTRCSPSTRPLYFCSTDLFHRNHPIRFQYLFNQKIRMLRTPHKGQTGQTMGRQVRIT